MVVFPLFLLQCLGSPGLGPRSDHGNNAVFAAIVREGSDLGGTSVRLPAPVMNDGQDAEAQRAALLGVAGSKQALADLLRDSVTAPFILKVLDARAEDGTVRRVDLWFVVRGDLEGIDPMGVASQASGRSVGAGNMEFRGRLLTSEELKPRGRSTLSGRDLSRWYVHVDGQLLDRIEVETTSEVMASRTAESLVIASRTDRAFDAPGPLANHWRPVHQGQAGPDQPYRGGVSYARIGRLKQPAGALLVELHASFIEPRAWFEGAPILRSKFAPIAQDQIRRLRRELQKERSKAPG
jgi:hypothetical protein